MTWKAALSSAVNFEARSATCRSFSYCSRHGPGCDLRATFGADDYLTKDISVAQLLARVSALLRRVEALRMPVDASDVMERGRVNIDQNRMQVHLDDKPVPLTVTEFWLVHSLARYPGHVKNRDQLMNDAGVVVDDGTITSHVKRIRRKFQSIAPDFEGIETVYGAGYRWKGSM